ncbi:hypothetical protein FOT68_12585 [Citrobacter braakii]|nr:hypothetical protein [Citrobacter braakii]
MFHFEPPESELFVQDPGFSTAIAPLTRSQVVLSQRSDITKVNVAIRRRQQIHYLRMCHFPLSLRPLILVN